MGKAHTRMSRFTRFQQGVVVVLLMGFLGVIGYQYLLSRSMRSDQETMRHLDEHVMQTPEMVSLTEKVERDRLLVKAIEKDDVEQVARFFQEGVRNRENVASQPIAMHAAHHGAEKVMAFLIEQGADINAPDGQGRTPLMEAVKAIYPVIVEMLLKHGAQADAVDKNGSTILMYAGIKYELAPDGQAKPVAMSIYGGPPAAANTEKPRHWDHKTVALILQPLLERGAKVGSADRYGRTAISYAVSAGEHSLARFLLDHGADPDDAFLNAAGSGNPAMLQLLLDKGADVKRKWPNGDTALAYAKRMEKANANNRFVNLQSYSRVVRLLMDAGASE